MPCFKFFRFYVVCYSMSRNLMVSAFRSQLRYYDYITRGKEKGKVNQLDVGNEKDQHNSGYCNPRTSKKTERTKPDDQQIRASDKNRGALRTSKQQY